MDTKPTSIAEILAHRPEAHAYQKACDMARGASVWLTVLPHRIETVATVLGLQGVSSVVPLAADATRAELAEQQVTLNARGLVVDRQRMMDFDLSEFACLAVMEPSGEITVLQSAKKTVSEDGTGLILMTSGSTGQPKYVPLTENKLLASAASIARSLDLSERDTAGLALPMFHIGAFVDLYLAPLLGGGQVRVLPPRDTLAMIAAAREGDITWAQMVPTQLAAFVRNMDDDTCAKVNAHLRVLRLVSADLSPDLQELAERRLPDVAIVQMYGMTETAGQITTNGLTPQTRRTGSVGRAAGSCVHIRTPLGRLADPGETGEVWVQSANLMPGYLRGVPVPIDAEGWFQTGDLGYLDRDGFLFLAGRAREVINRGGEKVSFQEVDRTALALPGVEAAACFAIPHVSLGQDLGLSFVSGSGGPDETALRGMLADRLPPHKLPRQFHRTESLTTLKGGKVDRAGLLQAWRAEQDQSPPIALSDAEKRLAAIWQDVLGVSVDSADADFFDLGGDSLSAEIVLTMVEEQYAIRLDPGVLYESPTLSALARDIAAAPSERKRSKLPARTLRGLRAATSAWSGRRLDPLGLVMMRNETAPGAPIFWLCNADVESTGLSFALADSHPVYVMRTLFRYKKKLGQRREIDLLERYYAEQISQIAAGQPIFLGGFCDGAKMAFNMLPLLETRSVKAFLCADQELPDALPMPALFARSADSLTMDRFTFRDAEAGLNAIAPKGYQLYCLEGGHVGMLAYPNILPLAEAIARVDQDGIETPDDPEDLAERRAWQAVKLRVAGPRISSPDQPFDLTVTLHNQSGRDWTAEDCAQHYLWVRFKNFDGMARVPKAAVANLPDGLPKGARVNIQMRVTYPSTRLPQLLQVGLVDDGLGWLPGHANRLMLAR